MKILIGTKNPGKIKGAKLAFDEYFENVEIEGILVTSNVSAQPVNEEIYNGAKNRVDNLFKYAIENHIDAEYFLAIESGITNLLGKWVILSVAIIKSKNGYESFGTSAGFPVPNKYVDEIINNELAIVMDRIASKKDLRSRGGGISFLTHDVISRIDQTKEAFIMALTQFINEDIWMDEIKLEKNKEKKLNCGGK